ncbi:MULTISPECIES: ABC transporter substrate-binding protein [Nocardioides]|uniref:ABC transporter substrate-binding protein n=1 Tax=Nocardioides vastitatis TaxID=2568655 RepID=A0ABW0ZBV6_9ACTN|nr:ABC transporter substrate-binding protein [Nocardioides sp.]THI96385.1 amino acid ABC transporter substrate-binding protein [Nocardioides sp.]
MYRPKKLMRLGVVGLAAALVLGACGEDGGDNGDTGTQESPTAEPKGDGVLTFGTLLPATGDLAFLGPPEFAGVTLAVQDINAAGGVLGKDVVQVKGDSGDGTPDIAGAQVDKLLAADSDVIVGAASSGVSITVIDKITGAGVVQFSPANTAAGFDTDQIDPNRLYFRTAPSDYLQGEILANEVIEDGFDNVAIMGRQDFYGEGLAERTRDVLEEKGGTVGEFILYNKDATTFTAEINKIAAAKPEAIVLVSFAETTTIIPQLIAKGLGPDDVQLYFVDGNLSNYPDENFNLEGVKGTAPASATPDPDFEALLKKTPPMKKNDALTYGPESYDAVIISALAAIAAGDDSGEAVGANIVDVTREGTKCTTFEECKTLLEDGEDIDYDGKSGPADMTDTGSLAAGTYGVYEYGANNTYEQIDTVSGLVPPSE